MTKRTITKEDHLTFKGKIIIVLDDSCSFLSVRALYKHTSDTVIIGTGFFTNNKSVQLQVTEKVIRTALSELVSNCHFAPKTVRLILSTVSV